MYSYAILSIFFCTTIAAQSKKKRWSTLKTEVTLTTCSARLEYHRVMPVAYGRRFASLHLSCDFYLRPSGHFVIKRENYCNNSCRVFDIHYFVAICMI